MKHFLKNKYTNLYFSIIAKAKAEIRNKNNNVYFEQHHIYPRSVWPELEKDQTNLVYLTAREHFICHYLLCKMVEKKSNEWHKLVRAFTFMYSSTSTQQRYFNSKLYELARKHIGSIMSTLQSGNKNSQFGTVWIYSDAEQHSIKIPKDVIDDYILLGYRKGRKISWQDPIQVEIKKIDRQIEKLTQRKNKLLAGPQGFEPRLTESKSVVLPLHYGPTKLAA